MRATLLAIIALVSVSAANAQMITTTTPFQSMGNSFFENNGVNWAFRGNNVVAQFGGAAPPPFGNPDPNAGLRAGFGLETDAEISDSIFRKAAIAAWSRRRPR